MGLKKGGISGLAKGIQKGAQTGAILGGSTGGLGTLASGRDERNLNRQYNKRLGQAQKQSLRREAADWKNNITNREGYTY